MKGYFKHIALKYNSETCGTLKEYCNEVKKLAQQQERLKFILSCRSYGIIPKHTRNSTKQVTHLFKCTTIKNKLEKIENNFHKKILNLEISQTNTNITLTKRKLFHLNAGIKNMISTADHTTFFNKQKDRTKQITKNIKEKQINKINTLKENQFRLHGLVFNDNWFENKTEYNIPIECKWILSLGKKFSLPVDKLSFSPLHVIADIEQCIQALDSNIDKEKDIARTKVANKVTTFKRNIKNTEKDKFILTIFEKTRKFLRDHIDVIVVQADKGNKTVLMYKNEYEKKMEILLEDKNTYKTIRVDPTLKLQKENNNIVSDLFKNNHIDSWQKRQLFCSAATAPRIYGLPKIHKPDTPLRPIVSSVQVPCYHMSKYIGTILKHLISETYNIKNSIEVKKQLTNIKVDRSETIVSFDVISLFTNIPVRTAIRTIMGKWNVIKNHTKMSSSQFLKILQFCLNDNNYFIYKDKIYNQIFGMPMGNPLSPTIADIILDNLLDSAIEELKNKNIFIKYIVKYVDDILAIIKSDDQEEILSTFNKYHSKIQFTIEREKNQEIAYLDTKLIRRKNSIIFDWFAKETSSGRIMNFHATQPKNQIINTAKNFISRILHISDELFHTKNKHIIFNILKSNSFPNKLISTLIEDTITQIKNKNDNNPTSIEKEQKYFYSVKYIPGLTDNKNIRTSIETNNISFAYKPNKTLSTIFSAIKAPINKQQQNNIVYELQCKGNNEQSCELIYIGTTKRSLETRMGEHMMDIQRKKETTALSTHILNTQHKIDFEGVRILDKVRGDKKRFTIESLRIQENIKKTMNVKEDTNNISANYRVAITK